jgi:hypothetical protein
MLGQQRVDLTGRKPNHFDVQVAGLSAEREIPDTTAGQPHSPASPTNDQFDAAKDVP